MKLMRNLKTTIAPTDRNVSVPARDAHNTSEPFKQALQALENAIVKKLAETPISRGNLLAVILGEQSTEIEALTPQWQRREVLRIIRRIQQQISEREAEADQYLLPGFEDLPRRIRLNGKRQHLATATYATLCEYLEIQERHQLENPRIIALRAMVKLMKRYVRDEPEITMREVCERESEK
jgi:hypothetical protein